MVNGTVKWTSVTREFGLVTPDDGARDVFVQFSSAIASSCIPAAPGEHDVKQPIAPTKRHQVASRVEVRTRYEQGQWARGYEVAEVAELGYRVRRTGGRDTLPDIFVPSDVRDAGD